MVDSFNSNTELMETALDKIKSYISSSYPDSETQAEYLRIIRGFEDHFSSSGNNPLDALADYYHATTQALPFERPELVTQRKKARPILMLKDTLMGEEPKRRYCYSGYIPLVTEFVPVMESYVKWMEAGGKRIGTITTRSGRMRVFFWFLHENNCISIASLTSDLLLSFIQNLKDKYSSQGKVNILYTLRNFFSCPAVQEELRFEPLLLLYGLHSRKHERLASCYTAEEIRQVMDAVDRSTMWGKTIYLMMLLACVYGLRASDIRELQQSSIHWKQKSISLYQQKTKRYIELPLTHEVMLALLDYIKNVRPNVQDPHLFIRLRVPHIPYSPNDHFSSKAGVYFEKAGIVTKNKHHGFHAMRHSLATELVTEGVAINEVAVILGHTTVESTNKYIWSDISHLKAVALEVPSYGK